MTCPAYVPGGGCKFLRMADFCGRLTGVGLIRTVLGNVEMVEAAGVEPASEVGRHGACYTLSLSLVLAARFPRDGGSSCHPVDFRRRVPGDPRRLARLDDAPSSPLGREERGTGYLMV